MSPQATPHILEPPLKQYTQSAGCIANDRKQLRAHKEGAGAPLYFSVPYLHSVLRLNEKGWVFGEGKRTEIDRPAEEIFLLSGIVMKDVLDYQPQYCDLNP